MNYIGDRISIQQNGNELSIVILSFRNELKNKLLLLWVILWTLCGIIVLTQYVAVTDPDVKTVMIVWIGFWAYFEYKVIAAYRWRKSGVEKIKIKEGTLFYTRSKGKTKEYRIDFIKDLHLIASIENSFFENLNDSYWMLGNESIGFDYSGADIKFGLQLDESDAKALLKKISKKLSYNLDRVLLLYGII